MFELKNTVFEMDEENYEISGEFGDNISMASNINEHLPGANIAPVPPLPDEITESERIIDCHNVIKSHHMKALIWKNFLWMWRNVG